MNEKKSETILDPQHRDQLEGFSRQHKTGVLTLVFTDMVGSTRIKQDLGDEAGVRIIRAQQAEVRDLLTSFPDSQEISTAGDSFFIAFLRPSDAVRFSLLLHARLREREAAIGHPVRVRIGIHMGEVFIEAGETADITQDLYGLQVDTTARIQGLADGGQTLMTLTVFDNARSVLRGKGIEGMGQLSWLDHGPYKVKGVEDPIRICEVGEEGIAPLTAPVKSDKAHRYVSEDQEPVLGWRPALDEPVPGTQWVLEEKLGEGGFGEVWRARHTSLHEQRVFKFCFRAEKVRSLKREVTLFRVLKERIGDHPHIVRMYDVFFDEPPYYIAMEYVDGRNLVQWCEEQGGVTVVPETVKTEIIAQAANALQAAHTAGIIHRDIKPANILVTGSGDQVRVKLSDFGIGQVTGREVVDGITVTGVTEMVVGSTSSRTSGTQLYMAPEIMAGKTASVQSDIYSLGVVLYQLLANNFNRPLTTDWHADIPDDVLATDLAVCFAGDPDMRFTAAADLERNLRTLGERRARTETERRLAAAAARRKKAVLLGGIIFSVLLAGTLALWYNFNREKKLRRQAEKEQYFATVTLAANYINELRYDKARAMLAGCKSDYRNWEWGRLARLCRLDKVTLRYHDGPVNCLAYNPEGTLLASGGEDGNVIIADGETGAQIKTISCGTPVNAIAYSPDGTWLAAACSDGIARKIDAASGTIGAKYAEDSDVMTVAVSPDNRTLVLGTWGHTVCTWDVATGKKLRTINGHRQQITAVLVTPDGSRIVSGSADGSVRQWDAGSGRAVSFVKMQAAVRSLDISSDGNSVRAGLADGMIEVRNIENGELLARTFMQSGVDALLEGSGVLAAGTDNNLVQLMEPRTLASKEILRGHSRGITGVAVRPAGGIVASASMDRTVKLWDIRRDKSLQILHGHTGPVQDVQTDRDGKYILSRSSDNTVRVWDRETGKTVAEYRVPLKYLRSAALAPGGNLVAAGSSGKTVLVWRIREKDPVHTLLVETGNPLVSFNTGADLLAATHTDTTVKIWFVSSGREQASADPAGGKIILLNALLPENGILTVTEDDTVSVWTTGKNNRFSWALPAGFGKRQMVLHAAAGELLILDKQRVLAYDIRTGIRTCQLEDLSEIYTVIPGKDRYILAYNDRMKVFSGSGEHELITLKDIGIRTLCGTFSPDGRWLITGGADRNVTVWPVNKWEEE